ncbi:hypothetical protein P171DRAFT_359567 [Karstenula rhodostoma CBS 690.94]|uniref:Zn(2)-C6 fungal-type domain-containing protein n=1 Tax=Karstenula rhodostoma CBS 690.94 TaxID=1392251 RepID=A0A9P4PK03_9PLEO|nr:hypothetical protein P171DRAFT_359567 [Karstenula rhodostoma CBS 690.94]
MPPNRVRTSNAQGRQKSCSECANAKRKCDLQQPNCLRCTRQRLTCTYPSRPHTSNSARTSTDPDLEDASLIEELFNPTLELPFDLEIPDVAAAPDLELLDPVPDLSDPMGNLEHGESSLQDFRRREVSELPSRIGRYPSAKSISNLIASELFESRVGYSMELWKLTPRMMVEKNCTPWSHPNLYEELMPRSMQDAFAACSLFISRTDINVKFVLRHITDRAHELVEQPIPTMPAEVIAQAQAVLLYQVMLICSDDFRYYRQTQTLLPHLKELSNSLYFLVTEDQNKDQDHAATLPLYPSSAARAAWLSFIFRESCRRTLLAVCHAVSICTLLAGDLVACNDAMAVGNRVTLSAALWEAKSPLEFAIAWNEKNHFLIEELDFSEVLRLGNADDVDVFGRMLMVGHMGADDVRGWLHSKGGKL